MGSKSSTRWEGVPTRVSVESCFTLAPPRGKLRPGPWTVEWPRTGVAAECHLARDGGGYVMSLRHNWHGGGATQFVRLAATRPHYSRGGVRWWYLCPGCGGRTSRQHLPGRRPVVREFKCRRCHGLTYESARGSRTKARETILALAREGGLTSGEARDAYRRYVGGYIHRAQAPYFGPRKVVVAPPQN